MEHSRGSSQDSTRFWRWISGLGIVFAILCTLGQILNDRASPDPSLGGAALVRYAASHGTDTVAAVFLLAFAVVALAFFLTALRRRVAGPEAGQDHLSLVLAIGGAIYGGVLLFDAVVLQAVFDAAAANQPAVADALTRLGSDTWLPVVTVLAVLGLGTGVAGFRSGRLPWWVSAPSLLIGALALAGPLGEVALILTPFWAVLLSVALFLRPPSRRRVAREPALEGA
jgi:hypothetical protein